MNNFNSTIINLFVGQAIPNLTGCKQTASQRPSEYFAAELPAAVSVPPQQQRTGFTSLPPAVSIRSTTVSDLVKRVYAEQLRWFATNQAKLTQLHQEVVSLRQQYLWSQLTHFAQPIQPEPVDNKINLTKPEWSRVLYQRRSKPKISDTEQKPLSEKDLRYLRASQRALERGLPSRHYGYFNVPFTSVGKLILTNPEIRVWKLFYPQLELPKTKRQTKLSDDANDSSQVKLALLELIQQELAELNKKQVVNLSIALARLCRVQNGYSSRIIKFDLSLLQFLAIIDQIKPAK